MNKKSITAGLLNSIYDFKISLFFEGMFVGAAAGMVCVLFRLIIDEAGNVRNAVYTYLSGGHILAVIGWFALSALAGILLGLLVKKIPMISGSGIPQVKGYLLNQFDICWLKDLIAKFFGGIAAIGFGLSLGREGPSVQLGASVGKGVGKMLKRSDAEEKYLVLGGAGAGLAAAFNAPLAGVVFVIEELQKNVSPAVLITVMGACVASDFVSKQIIGMAPVFQFGNISALPLGYYPVLLLLGIACGLLSKLFNLSIIKFQDIYAKIPKKFSIIKPVIPLLSAGVLGFVLPDVLGGGQSLINDISGNFHIGLTFILLLIAAKLVFTSLCFGSGVPGGIFLPLLVVGALIGKSFGILSTNLLGLDSGYEVNFLILGMAAFFSGVVRSPITGSILITEMTGSFHHLLALLTVSMTAYVVTDAIKSFAIYERLLDRMLSHKNSSGNYSGSQDKIIMEVPVCIGSYLEGRRIRDVKWPEGCLVVAVRRGEKEIIPNGNTLIISGDCVIVLADKDRGKNDKIQLVGLGQPQ